MQPCLLHATVLALNDGRGMACSHGSSLELAVSLVDKDAVNHAPSLLTSEAHAHAMIECGI